MSDSVSTPSTKSASPKTAKEVLLEFTASSFRDPLKAAQMFSIDGNFEAPYLASFGVPSRYTGHEAIAGFFQFVRDLYPDLELENVKVLIETPEQVFAEYEFRAVSTKTKRAVHQLLFGRLVVKDGKINLLREALNNIEIARGIVEQSSFDLYSEPPIY